MHWFRIMAAVVLAALPWAARGQSTEVNVARTGLARVMHARDARRHVLVLTDEPRMARAWYERSRPAGGLTGFYATCAWGYDREPFTLTVGTAGALPAEVTASGTMWSYRHDYQPNVSGGGTVREAYIYDTAATALDGTAGEPAVVIAGGFRELMWDASAPVDGDAPLGSCALGAGYTQVVSPTWYQAALTVTAVWHGPAEHAAGVNPIVGNPGLKAGAWRGAGAVTLSAGTFATTNAGYYGESVSLAAASGLPRGGFYASGDEAFSNLGTRAVPMGIHFSQTSATVGLDLVVVDMPCGQHLDVGLDATTYGPEPAAWQGIADALGIDRFDAVVIDLGANVGAGWVNGSTIDDLSALAVGATAPTGTWAEYNADLENALRLLDCVGTAPIVWVSPHFTGHATDLGAPAVSMEIANLIRRSADSDYRYLVRHPENTVFGAVNGAYIDWYDHGGSDGPNSPLTQNTVLAGGVIENGCSIVRGAYSAAANYAVGDGVYDGSGASVTATGATPWYVCVAASGPAVESVGAKDLDDPAYWQPMDFRPTAAYCAAKVDFFWEVLERAGSGSSGALSVRRHGVRSGSRRRTATRSRPSRALNARFATPAVGTAVDPHDHIDLMHKELWRYCRGVGGGRALYEELLGHAWETLVNAARTYRPELGFRFSTLACRALRLQLIRRHAVNSGLKKRYGARAPGGGRGTGYWQAPPTPAGDVVFGQKQARGGEDQVPGRVAQKADAESAARASLAVLTESERTVVEHHVMAGRTLRVVGAMLGVSGERVRQLREGALAKLRAALGVEAGVGARRAA